MTVKKIKTKRGEMKWEVNGRVGGRGSQQIRRRFDRKEDAERFRIELIREKQLGAVLAATRMTLDEYAAEWWTRWRRDRPENTIRNYRGSLNRYVLPRLGKIQIAKLKAPTVAQYRDALLAEGKGRATIRYSMAVLSSICADAVERGAIASNPVGLVKKPSASVAGEAKALSVDEIEALRGSLASERDKLLVSLMAYGGLRPEEALALTWPDVREQVLNIDKAVTHGELKPTKTEQRRAVDLLDALSDDLASYRCQLQTTPGPGSWVFPHPQDPARPWSDSMYRNWRERIFKLAAEKMGLDVTPYDLRRTFVSLLLSCGLRRGEVAEQAGHSLAVMEKHYAVTIAAYRGVQLSDPNSEIRNARDSLARDALS